MIRPHTDTLQALLFGGCLPDTFVLDTSMGSTTSLDDESTSTRTSGRRTVLSDSHVSVVPFDEHPNPLRTHDGFVHDTVIPSPYV